MNRRKGVRLRPTRWRAESQRGIVVLCAVACLLATLGCVATKVGSFDAYKKIPMNRVVPYPGQDELQKRVYAIAVVDDDTVGIDEGILAQPREQVRRALEGIAREAGATVIDSLPSRAGEGQTSEAVDASGPDFALATRFSTLRYVAEWKPPFKFLWQTQEDISEKRGTCTHRVEVALDVQVVDLAHSGRVSPTYALGHAVEQANKDIDSACTIAPVARAVMFENALDDAMSCLTLPLGSLLSPRGYVTAHRKERDGEGHLYRISLGSAHGIDAGDEIEIRRVQRAVSPEEEEVRLERLIATGVVTDQVRLDRSWVAIDPTKAAAEILDGDLARGLRSEGLLSSLSGPKCGEILRE